MRFGLTEQAIERIHRVLARHHAVESAVIFGSRARGSHKPGSDVDLTLRGEGLSARELGIIEDELDDLLLPMKMDLTLFDQITHEPLKEHIQRAGVVFYERPVDAGRGAARETGSAEAPANVPGLL